MGDSGGMVPAGYRFWASCILLQMAGQGTLNEHAHFNTSRCLTPFPKCCLVYHLELLGSYVRYVSGGKASLIDVVLLIYRLINKQCLLK